MGGVIKTQLGKKNQNETKLEETSKPFHSVILLKIIAIIANAPENT